MSTVRLSYPSRSDVLTTESGATVALAPNLARERVSFDGEVDDPLRFREAMSALHEVVVGDLRYKPRDKSAYVAFKAREQAERQAVATRAYVAAHDQARRAPRAPRPDLKDDFRRAHRLYWRARNDWSSELRRNDPELFRHLVPCDPVISVAPDTVFFEAFSKDESSYGCLYVDRGAFRTSSSVALGTTNVDYSQSLYDHLQTLRSYRSTRISLDPKGFDVEVAGRDGHREEKIELPSSWLRGFGQISAATMLGQVSFTLPTEVVYALLAFLRRRREKTGPRSIRVRLVPGKPPELVLDPWGTVLTSRGPRYEGPRPEEIKLWGRRRLLAFARTLPLAERFEVTLLGSGMPSLWVAHLAGMRFVLALSGWTSNDWTGSLSLDMLAGDLRPDLKVMHSLTTELVRDRSATLNELAARTGAARDALLGSLVELARHGQVVFDPDSKRFRYRSVLATPITLSSDDEASAELAGSRALLREGAVSLDREELLDGGRVLLVGTVAKVACEVLLDPDGRMLKARCGCSYHHQFGLRKGPCRHLFALRVSFDERARRPSASSASPLIH
ncbi:MAG: SWIM zinc finger family protein [Polyangiaceae bacterium]